MPSLIEAACAAVRLQAAARGVAVRAACGPRAAVVWADEERAGQVLINLLDNAVKYAPRGTAVVVRAHPVSGRALAGAGAAPCPMPGPTPGRGTARAVRITVTDAGPGLPPGAETHVFDAF